MPTIANSTLQVVGSPVEVTNTLAPAVGTTTYVPLRGTLPSNEVLATVTQQAISQTGASPTWQLVTPSTTTVVNNNTTTVSGGGSSSGGGSTTPITPVTPQVVLGSYTTTPTGNSFQFYTQASMSYYVYRNSSATFSTATLIQVIPQTPVANLTLQVSDPVTNSSSITYTYWIAAVNSAGTQSSPTNVGAASTGGTPQEVTGVAAVSSPYLSAGGTVLAIVGVDFTPAPNDPYYDSVNIYFVGYNGNYTPQLMANATQSPASFLCQMTNETVQVMVIAVSSLGTEASFADPPSAYVTLNDNVQPPPFPSIAVAQTALPGNTGWQFTFNIIGGMEFSQVSNYRVYHSESNVTPVPPSSYFRTIPQPATNVGQEVVQEVTSDLLFYWVSAINLLGMESELTPVPFTYIDPGAPPPNVNPITNTVNYYPQVTTNGGFTFTGQFPDAVNPLTDGLSPIPNGTALGEFTNPAQAYDGNTSTAATYNAYKEFGACIWSFSNFTASTVGANTLTLNVLMDVVGAYGYNVPYGSTQLYYSTDGGTTWSEPISQSYSINGATVSAAIPKAIVTTTLPTTVNPAQVQVAAVVGGLQLTMEIYEIYITMNSTISPGPQQVTGVSAALVNGDVQITWSGLTPLSRTDITAYNVYRALHGAGYATSHLQVSVPPSPPQTTYSWSDPEGHDGSWDYWVVAENSTGYSTPSAPVYLQNAAAVLYSSGGATVDSLMPAQAGATLGATWGTNVQSQPQNINNLIIDPSFENGSVGGWGASVVEVNTADFVYALSTNERDTNENGNVFSVTAGETYFVSGWCNTSGCNVAAVIGLFFTSTSGSPSWSGGAYLAAGTGWTFINGSLIVPSGFVSATPWLQIAGTAGQQGNVLWSQLYIGKFQQGADVTALNTANDTSNVNGVASHLVSPISGLMPRQAGADVTAQNTSANTNALGGYGAGSITPIVNLMPAQAGADVTSLNTSANSNALGGYGASSITPITGLMPRQPGADVTAQNTAYNSTQLGGVAAGSITPIQSLMPAQAGANVTSEHIITSYVTSIDSAEIGEWMQIPSMSWTTSVASTSDIFNVSATINIGYGGGEVQFNMGVMLDGNTSSPLYTASYSLNNYTGNSNTVLISQAFFCSATGISAGNHTLGLYIEATYVQSGDHLSIQPYSQGMCQRIY